MNKYIELFLGLFALLIVFSGCYTESKANKQFNKAAVSYPKIPAEFCSTEFPIKESVKTDKVLSFDTLYVEGLADTVMIQDFDTVRMYITKTLPAQIIKTTIHIRDTIIKESTAALELCEFNRRQLTDLLVKKTDESDKYKGQAKKRGLFLWSLIALIVLIIGLTIYFKTRKTIKV